MRAAAARRSISTTAVALLTLAAPVFGQSTQPASRKGVYDITFEQSSPLSGLDIQHERYGLEKNPINGYELSKESFIVNVPNEFDASDSAAQHWGLLVWCNAGGGEGPGGEKGGEKGGGKSGGKTGGVPKDWVDALAANKLICVAAYNAGNDRSVGVRIGLALDAVFNMRQRYALDPHRTYIAGVSGGGKVSGMAAMAFPEVFDGAICCAGVNWYRNIPVPDKPHVFWGGTYQKASMLIFADARDHVGFVLIAGDQDPNYAPVKGAYEQGFLPDDFKHVTMYEVPGLGHRAPPVEWFIKGLAFLDAIPKDRVKKLPATRTTTGSATRPAQPTAATTIAPSNVRPAGADPSEPARLLSLARTYRSNNMNDKARQKLQQLIRDYPASEEAKVARTMIEQMNAQER